MRTWVSMAPPCAQNGIARDEGVRKALQFMGALKVEGGPGQPDAAGASGAEEEGEEEADNGAASSSTPIPSSSSGTGNNGAGSSGNGAGAGQKKRRKKRKQQDIVGSLTLPLEFDPQPVLSAEQAQQLAAFMTGQPHSQSPSATTTAAASSGAGAAPGGRMLAQVPARAGLLKRALGALGLRQPQAALPWPQPPLLLTAKQRLALETHAHLYGFSAGTTAGSGAAAAMAAAGAPPAMAQRPPLAGPDAATVGTGSKAGALGVQDAACDAEQPMTVVACTRRVDQTSMD